MKYKQGARKRKRKKIPVGERFFPPFPTSPGVKWVPSVFPGGNAAEAWRGVALATNPHIASRLKRSRGICLVTLWAFMASSGANFTFFTFDLNVGAECSCCHCKSSPVFKETFNF